MKKVLSFIIIIQVCLISCERQGLHQLLKEMESSISVYPDSVLASIKSVDTTTLRSRRDRARYSLLYAMALDKCWIDTTDTRVVMPAVDYFGKHGTADQKLKAYYYLGIEQLNGKNFSEAIVSFTKAKEYAGRATDDYQCGLLYAALADTYTSTMEYAEATDCIDKSIECFKACGRNDVVSHLRLRKARNLANTKNWDEAKAYYKDLLSDSTIVSPLRESVMADYAMVSITSPEPDDSLALAYLSSVYAKTGKLENPNQYGAYAYSLQSAGRLEESESVFRKMCDAGMSDNVYYDYWKHRALLTGGDVEQAFPLLLSSMRQSDSISAIAFSVSSANAQREYLESVNRDKDVKIRDQRTTLIINILVSVIAFLLLLFLLQRRKAKQKEEHERMVAVMDSFEGQVKKLEKEKNKAKFAYLSELYEEVYIKTGGSKDASMEKMYRILRDRISTLDSSPEAQSRFENMLDEESGDIMKSFRRDFPEMSDSDCRMASYVFAGFDNTTIMLLMDISSLENTRTIKSRLKRRIINSSVNDKDTYLRYF